MAPKLNIANSLFAGLNDKRGILICGYEWGFSKEDQRLYVDGYEPVFDPNAVTIFSNKVPSYGERALAWRYDKRIIKWFGLWGHPLSGHGLGGEFEKCLVQTNWCNTQGHSIAGNYCQRLSQAEQVENFLFHAQILDPSLIIFMGSAIIDVLQAREVMEGFVKTAGKQIAPLRKVQKEFVGRRFKIGFQTFERCEVVCLPHPSSSRGLSDDYMLLFKQEIGELISTVKAEKGVGKPNPAILGDPATG